MRTHRRVPRAISQVTRRPSISLPWKRLRQTSSVGQRTSRVAERVLDRVTRVTLLLELGEGKAAGLDVDAAAQNANKAANGSVAAACSGDDGRQKEPLASIGAYTTRP